MCFLLLWFVLLPTKDKLSNLRATVNAMTKEYEETRKIQSQYNTLKRETDPVMKRILQRRKDFDLSAFVAETEQKQNFSRTREIPVRPTAYGDFEKRSSTFLYDDKSINQIVEFVTGIEKPENVIGIEFLRVTPKSASDRSHLKLEIKLATVVATK